MSILIDTIFSWHCTTINNNCLKFELKKHFVVHDSSVTIVSRRTAEKRQRWNALIKTLRLLWTHSKAAGALRCQWNHIKWKDRWAVNNTQMSEWSTSSAIAVIADRTECDVWYSYRPLAGITVVSISIYLFTVIKLNSVFDAGKSAVDACQLFSRSLCFMAKRYILQQKCLKKWIGSAVLCTTLQLSTPTRSWVPQYTASHKYKRTDRRTDDSMIP